MTGVGCAQVLPRHRMALDRNYDGLHDACDTSGATRYCINALLR